MYEFTYHKPASLDEIANLLGANEDAKLVAGGMTLIPTLKQRLAKPSDLVDLAAIASLRGITDAGDALVIGAMTRHGEVHNSPIVKQGDSRPCGNGRHDRRPRGAQPRHDRRLDLEQRSGGGLSGGPGRARRHRAHDQARDRRPKTSFTGMFETALEPTEIVTAVRFPKPQVGELPEIPQPGLALCDRRRLCRPHRFRRAGRGYRRRPRVFRVPEMEAALAKSFTPDAIKDIAIPDTGLNADIHASAEYRAHLVGVMARRAVAACG